MDNKKLHKVAIVTGSATGIGAATAIELSKRGWGVAINYSKSADAAKKVQAQCEDAILWLITGARQTTGETLFIDGGMHVATPR